MVLCDFHSSFLDRYSFGYVGGLTCTLSALMQSALLSGTSEKHPQEYDEGSDQD